MDSYIGKCNLENLVALACMVNFFGSSGPPGTIFPMIYIQLTYSWQSLLLSQSAHAMQCLVILIALVSQLLEVVLTIHFRV